MKILQINSVCGIGSTGRIATDIHDLLIEQGHESYIAYGRDLHKNCNTVIKIGTKLDNYLHAAITRLFDKHGFGSKKATEEFIKKIEKLDPDIIHLHNIHGYYINIELLFNYIKKANKPVIWTLHDCWAFTGHCAYFDYIGCGRWKTGCYSCPQKETYPTSRWFDNSKNNYIRKKEIFSNIKNITVVTPSKWLANLAKGSFLGNYPIEIIPNGVDLEIFRPTENNFRQKYNLQNKFIILGVASTWNKRKGFDFLIELSKKLKTDEIIVMVGLTKKQHKKLPKNIIGIIRTNNVKELAEIYTAVDVFVNPTLEDNFPTTNLEALACATPVITFKTGGSIECVDEKCGFIVEKGSLEELIEKIHIVKAKHKSFFSKEAQYHAEQFYNKRYGLKKYIDIYKILDCKKIGN